MHCFWEACAVKANPRSQEAFGDFFFCLFILFYLLIFFALILEINFWEQLIKTCILILLPRDKDAQLGKVCWGLFLLLCMVDGAARASGYHLLNTYHEPCRILALHILFYSVLLPSLSERWFMHYPLSQRRKPRVRDVKSKPQASSYLLLHSKLPYHSRTKKRTHLLFDS